MRRGERNEDIFHGRRTVLPVFDRDACFAPTIVVRWARGGGGMTAPGRGAGSVLRKAHVLLLRRDRDARSAPKIVMRHAGGVCITAAQTLLRRVVTYFCIPPAAG